MNEGIFDNDYFNYLTSLRNSKWYFHITLRMIIKVIIIIINWCYIGPEWYEEVYKKLKQFKGFKYSHLTNQKE